MNEELKKEKLFFRASELKEDLVSSRGDVFSKGFDTGFRVLDEICSFKTSYTTIIYSPPHVGKSVITMDILMAQAEMGRSTCIYSPEFRDKKELMQALIQARLKKCFFGEYASTITDDEFLSAVDFIDKYFVIIVKPKRKKDNSQDKMSIKNIFRQVDNAAKAYKTKFDFLFIDPFNYIEKDFDEKFMDTQDYVLSANDQFAEYSEAMGIHTLISAHTRDIDLVCDKDTGILHYPIGHPSWIMGGQSWFRSSFQILHYWRAPKGVYNPKTSSEYPDNYTKLFIQKSKPFGVGKLGNTGDFSNMEGLYFDPAKYVMYEIVDGKPYYRNEYYNKVVKQLKHTTESDSALQPNLNFGFDDLESPF